MVIDECMRTLASDSTCWELRIRRRFTDAARRRAPRGKQCYRKVMNCQYGPARNMFTTVASATGRRKLLTLQRIHGCELSRDAVDLTM